MSVIRNLSDSIIKGIRAATTQITAINPAVSKADIPFNVEKFSVTTDATTTSTNNIPAGSTIIGVYVDITTAYSAGATMQIGKLGTLAYILDTTDITITTQQLETYHATIAWASAEKVYITIAGSPALGACDVYIIYRKP